MTVNLSNVENQLKYLFQKLVIALDKISMDSQTFSQTQNFYSANQNVESLVLHITMIFNKYEQKVEQLYLQRKSNNQYESLEKQLQTQQAEIRNHIRIQQQMKLYSESIQTKLEECQKQKSQLQLQFQQKLQSIKAKYEKIIEENNRQIKQKDMNTINFEQSYPNLKNKLISGINNNTSQINLHATINRYQPQNRRTPIKYRDNSIYGQKQTINQSNNSIYLGRAYQQESKYSSTYHSTNNYTQDKVRGMNREDALRKNTKINSIHILPKKSSIYGSFFK